MTSINGATARPCFCLCSEPARLGVTAALSWRTRQNYGRRSPPKPKVLTGRGSSITRSLRWAPLLSGSDRGRRARPGAARGVDATQHHRGPFRCRLSDGLSDPSPRSCGRRVGGGRACRSTSGRVAPLAGGATPRARRAVLGGGGAPRAAVPCGARARAACRRGSASGPG